MGKLIDLTGKRFGRWLVIGKGEIRERHVTWTCKCDCGAIKDVLALNLRTGQSISCGCSRNDGLAKIFGLEYNSWLSMKALCANPSRKDYKHYGGRGIRVCRQWKHSFNKFFSDMGQKPTKSHILIRIDKEKDFTLSNCVWATRTESNNNRRNCTTYSYNGTTATLAQWGRIKNMSKAVLYYRVNKAGWGIEKALTTPIWGKRKNV